MSTGRQEARWTAELWGDSSSTVSYRVTSRDGDFVAYVDVPPGDEGRSTVAKMVAAPDALTVLGILRRALTNEGNGWQEARDYLQLQNLYDGDLSDEALLAEVCRAALEAAKRLP